MIAWCSGVLIKDGVYFVFGGTLFGGAWTTKDCMGRC
jgi:hypothetical protein